MQVSKKKKKILQSGWWDLEYFEVMKMSLSKSDKSFPVTSITMSPVPGTMFITSH